MRTLRGNATTSQGGPESNYKEGVVHVPQSSGSGALPSDIFVSYPPQKLWVSYPSADVKSAYSADLDDRVVSAFILTLTSMGSGLVL